MRVAITGATGNIGTSLVRVLSADERVSSVLGIARRTPEWTVPKTEWVAADLAEDDLDGLFAGCDAVVHLGWLLQPTRDPDLTWRVNVGGSRRVFEAVGRAGAGTLLYSSSIGAYSPRVDPEPVDESYPTDGSPLTAYTREKAYVERMLDLFETHHPEVRTVRFRLAFVFKRKSASQQRRLFAGPLLPGRLVRPRTVPIMPVVDGIRVQAVHADDVAEAFASALFGEVSGAFNLAADEGVGLRAIAELLDARPVPMPFGAARAALAAAYRARLVPVPPGLLEVVNRLPVMDSARARNELEWRPRRTTDEALGEFLEGLRTGSGMATPPMRPRVEGGRRHELRTGVGKRP